MGIFDFLSGLASGRQEKELHQFITRVKGLDDIEVGSLMAYATAFRNMLDIGLEHDLGRKISILDPFTLAAACPDLIFRLHRMIKIFQKQGKYVESSGAMIWLHTLRAAENPDLRLACREMWEELQRGFPYVTGFQQELDRTCDFPVFLVKYDQFPEGMEPRNINNTNSK